MAKQHVLYKTGSNTFTRATTLRQSKKEHSKSQDMFASMIQDQEKAEFIARA
jgi:hypothetical protein